MTIPRPALFSRMGAAFQRAFGNADAVFTIDGVAGEPVRVILRQMRADDLVEEAGIAVEGTVHTMSVPVESVPGITSGRDHVVIDSVTYGIGQRVDDGRSMARFILDGDI